PRRRCSSQRCRWRSRIPVSRETIGVPWNLGTGNQTPDSHRQCIGRRSRLLVRGSSSAWLGLAIDQLLQLLAWLEVGHLLRRHIDLVAGLGIAALTRLALAKAEAAESPQLNLLAAVKGVNDAAKYRVHDDFGVLLRQI